MNSTIPAELLELKQRVDTWRSHRRNSKEKAPDDLKAAILEITERYPKYLIRKVLKISYRWLLEPTNKKKQRSSSANPAQSRFFTFPVDMHKQLNNLAVSQNSTDCRIQIERPDGSRLSLTIPYINSDSIFKFCFDFTRE